MKNCRCSKVIEDTNTHHIIWSRVGKELQSNEKYSLRSTLNSDFCENFNSTSDVVSKFHLFGGSIDKFTSNNEWNWRCLTSVLVIHNITENDLAAYQCFFNNTTGPHGGDMRYFTVFKIDSGDDTPKNILYFQDSYPKGITSNLLMQCLVTGGTVHWFISLAQPDARECDPRINTSDCSYSNIRPIDEVPEIDAWRCFKYSVESHTPYQFVSESFLLFEGVCGVDGGNVLCCVDAERSMCSEARLIVAKDEDEYWGTVASGGKASLAGLACLVLLTGVFIGGVCACIRSRSCCSCCCSCCSRSNNVEISRNTLHPSRVPQPTTAVSSSNNNEKVALPSAPPPYSSKEINRS